MNKLAWNWLWFLPLCFVVLCFVESYSVSHAIDIAKLAYQRWSWFGLFSPSAAFCYSAMCASVLLPIYWLGAIAAIMIDDIRDMPKRLLNSFLVAAMILGLPLLTDALIWGSFPFPVDAEGRMHLRLIPFVPWPSLPYGVY